MIKTEYGFEEPVKRDRFYQVIKDSQLKSVGGKLPVSRRNDDTGPLMQRADQVQARDLGYLDIQEEKLDRL